MFKPAVFLCMAALVTLGAAGAYLGGFLSEPDETAQAALSPLETSAPTEAEHGRPNVEVLALQEASVSLEARGGPRIPLELADPSTGQEPFVTGRVYATAPPEIPKSGTTAGAVWRGLHWLEQHQSSDGSWNLEDLHPEPSVDFQALTNSAHEPGQGDVTATSLALLAFLADGHTMSRGRYKKVVSRGVKWLVARQDRRSGRIGPETSEGVLRAHAIATLVWCEAYWIDKSIVLKQRAERAIDYIVRSHDGGDVWTRETLTERNPSSQTTPWIAAALDVAQGAQLDVDEDTVSATADALSVRYLLGQRKPHDWIAAQHPELPNDDSGGSWSPTGATGAPNGNRSGATALAVICLRATLDDCPILKGVVAASPK